MPASEELTAQTGHPSEEWPLVIVKELIDNALDACEEAGIAPEISVRVGAHGITVIDNGPGLPAQVVEDVLDFSVRVSSREAYVSPSRGAQGNALKTLVAMPFALDGKAGRVEVDAQGVRHKITFAVDPIRQQPVIRHERRRGLVKSGTRVTVRWPSSASSMLRDAETALFTNALRLRLAEPAPHARLEMVRRDVKDRGDRSVVDEVATVRPDVGALVWN